MTDELDYDPGPGGRTDYATGLICGLLIGVAAGAIFTGLASRKQPCNCHDADVEPDGPGDGYGADVDWTDPTPATPAVPHANGHQPPPPGDTLLDTRPLPPPTANKGPASPSRALFHQAGAPVSGPWAGHGNN